MPFSRTLPRELVHRAAVAEVYLTAAERHSDDVFDMCAQIPRSHAFYGDTLGPRTSYDPMVLVEIARQSCLALTQKFLGVALTELFLLRTAELQVLDATRLATRTLPTEVMARCVIERRLVGRSGPTGLIVRCVLSVDGVDAAVVRMTFSWVDQPTWEGIRRTSRSRRGLSGQPVPCTPPAQADASAVGRRDPSNVVITTPVPDGSGGLIAHLVVDISHPTMFDHPLDHIPGMLQLEAFRQLSVAFLAGSRPPVAPHSWLVSLSARFRDFAELDLPCVCRLTPTGQVGESRCTLSQADSVLTEGTVHLADLPRTDDARVGLKAEG